MTELKRFLVAMYDALSEAEVEALAHGQNRLAELIESGDVPPETASVPVYHAADVDVTLDVDLRVEETDSGVDVYVTESGPDSDSELTFSVELFELLERRDLENLDYEDVLGTLPGSGRGDSDGDTQEGGRSGDGEESGDEEGTSDGDEEGTSGENERADDPLPVETIDGIGPTYGERLRDRGVGTVADLAAESPETVAGLASTADQTVSTERAAAWVEAATANRPGRGADDTDDDRHT